MGLHSLFGLDRYSVLTGLTENVNLTGNMSDHEDKKDLGLNSDMEEICICGTIRWRYLKKKYIVLTVKWVFSRFFF
jgi:hypothetical protein